MYTKTNLFTLYTCMYSLHKARSEDSEDSEQYEMKLSRLYIALLHLEWPKLYGVLAILSAILTCDTQAKKRFQCLGATQQKSALMLIFQTEFLD